MTESCTFTRENKKLLRGAFLMDKQGHCIMDGSIYNQAECCNKERFPYGIRYFIANHKR